MRCTVRLDSLDHNFFSMHPCLSVINAHVWALPTTVPINEREDGSLAFGIIADVAGARGEAPPGVLMRIAPAEIS